MYQRVCLLSQAFDCVCFTCVFLLRVAVVVQGAERIRRLAVAGRSAEGACGRAGSTGTSCGILLLLSLWSIVVVCSRGRGPFSGNIHVKVYVSLSAALFTRCACTLCRTDDRSSSRTSVDSIKHTCQTL